MKHMRMLKVKSFLLMLSLCLVLIPSIAFAGVFTGGFPASNVQDLRYVLSGGDTNYQTNIMSAGANLWNGISSKVSVSKNSSGSKVSIYDATGSDPSLYGEMVPYYRHLGVLVVDTTCTNVWERAVINGYDNEMSGLSTARKRAVFGHEMGHALSLSHGNYYDIMWLDASDVLHFGQYPSDDDENWLITKWGA